ncbi:hypothetical protein PIB30_026932 [Stylosanthes scabra]|uniref:Ubiquitin-like protease family profile domain-containing protein n=1 Tax=Stylosanthes scabra TaxID=79078 RepID=A0ABU6YAU5_9FABA|nr:hypothetical protein [Stylosanthes scabra]
MQEQEMVSYAPSVEPIQVECSVPSFSLEISQQSTPNTQHDCREIEEKEGVLHQEHKTIALPKGADVDKLYTWATGSNVTENFTLAWIMHGHNIALERADLLGMGPHGKVSGTAMILTEKNIKHYMEKLPGYLETLTRNLEGKKWFNAELWFVPVCLDEHWWLYLLHRNSEQLWVLDSIHSGISSEGELAVSIEGNTTYAGERFICSYESHLPKQPNTNNCCKFEKELVMDMLFCKDNVAKAVAKGFFRGPAATWKG